MVVFKEGNQRFGVVDGQQRLTTITLVLATLRDALAEMEFDDLAHGIQGLIERKNSDNKSEFVLSPETSYCTAPLGLDRLGQDVALCDEAEREGLHHGSKTKVQRRLQAAGGGGVAGGGGQYGAVVSAL
jgi:hypothetical protein